MPVFFCLLKTFYLANSPALHRLLLHLGKVVVIGDNVSDDRFLIRVLHAHICMGNNQIMLRMVQIVPFPLFLAYKIHWPQKNGSQNRKLLLHFWQIPSASKRLVMPSFSSATLKALLRFPCGLLLLSCSYLMRSGLQRENRRALKTGIVAKILNRAGSMPIWKSTQQCNVQSLLKSPWNSCRVLFFFFFCYYSQFVKQGQ